MVAATAVADLAAEALKHVSNQSQQPPAPLPPGWLMKESRSQPNSYYYYNQETGESMWSPPFSLVPLDEEPQQLEEHDDKPYDPLTAGLPSLQQPAVKHEVDQKPIKSESDSQRSRKRGLPEAAPAAIKTEDVKPSAPDKKRRTGSSGPSEVRVLHILRKHKDSRRPSSWRTNNQPITITREEAVEELNGLLEILHEDQANPENLIATFKELASEESDCSSAKRNGDLGFFGRKKMRPEFEEAAFGLDINQLSGIVETASGAHILLRLE
uniref:Peptidyl-prolyl cis-trans isomerase n=1 Tax=Entomoneis paludosa TaxID=265537 RepID=A0A7S2Y2Q8_9STRA|mmetsp:Transcript_1242/g.2731  ORF Transcript_1242/g.2731 Transcript_1242/m.2731 type:complete len:269 (+) Transcript_1242:131-937(+)|eukprot:CAMPEP_0172465414 /NCGR_PEP_ID=MMETSP1065-20121228/53461_1 /TAXON_ID=265537 /ORGANISM="Amphiprora paludosa, Strain CCMP125" /LENGTH=268 /DNA_ID=CAMNT_0013221935 /DNA_START=32 /DNA_END=838 /DNA_ORIENTATION=-